MTEPPKNKPFLGLTSSGWRVFEWLPLPHISFKITFDGEVVEKIKYDGYGRFIICGSHNSMPFTEYVELPERCYEKNCPDDLL